MRKIVLDVETTGLDVKIERITEIGCVEIIDNRPSGNIFHSYLNPEKLVGEESFKITGLSDEFLRDKPIFAEIVDDLMAFIGDSPIIAHNAKFDISFLNMELEKIFMKILNNEIIDTLAIARKQFSRNNSLDGLCKKFKIPLDSRELHGALLDAQLLAQVYGFLCYNEDNFNFTEETEEILAENFNRYIEIDLSEEDLILHENFLKKIKGTLF